MSIRRIALRTISETISAMRIFSQPRSGLRILMYHSIGGHAIGDDQGIFSISEKIFREHIKLLASMHKLSPVALHPSSLQGQGTRIAVTFDDGYLDNLRVAAPILMEYDIPFTVFVSSDFIKNKNTTFMTPEDLKELASLPGVTIGAHGKSHARLTDCSESELCEELSASKEYLENLLGIPVTSLAYPFGAVDRRVRDAAETQGYTLGASVRFDINGPDRDPLLLCRNNIECNDNVRVLRQKLIGNWDWFRIRTSLLF